MQKSVILFGPPGSGKGTQAKKLANLYGFKLVSMGVLIREEIKKGTPEGRQAKKVVESGCFLDDMHVKRLLKKRVAQEEEYKFVFDGFPRTLSQADMLDCCYGMEIGCFVDVHVPSSDLIQRLMGRYLCQGCGETYHRVFRTPRTESICDVCGFDKFIERKDDEECVIRKRLEIFEKHAALLRERYHQILCNVDGTKTPDQVFQKIASYIPNELQNAYF